MSKEIKKEVNPVSGGIVDKAAAEKNAQIITINVLKAYAKGIVGKQRKYLDAVPKFDVDEVAEAMRFAAYHLSFRLPPAAFFMLVEAACTTRDSVALFIKNNRKQLAKSDADRLSNAEKRLAELKIVCKDALSICRRIKKNEKKVA